VFNPSIKIRLFREIVKPAFNEFIFGINLKSYTFNKYKTLNKEKINKKIDFKIVTSHKQKIEVHYKYCDAVKEGVFLTRDLVSEPPNVLSPKTYVDKIKKLLQTVGVFWVLLH